MRDYAKKDFTIPKNTKKPSAFGEIIACMIMGAILGGLFGYGLLFTGV